MAKFLSSATGHLLLVFASLIGGGVGLAATRSPDRIILGTLDGAVLRFEDLTNPSVTFDYPIDSSELKDVCQRGACEAAWSFGEEASWVAVRNLLGNQVFVVNQYGKLAWSGSLNFEVRSMLSVSRDGGTVAAIGRVGGVDSLWHVKARSSLSVSTLPLVARSERLQVGWSTSGGQNILSDGESTFLCGTSEGHECRKLFKGHLTSVSPDGRIAAVLANATTVELYELEHSRLVARYVSKIAWSGDSAKWSPDSKRVVLHESTKDGSRLVVLEFPGGRRLHARKTNDRSFAHVGIVWFPSVALRQRK